MKLKQIILQGFKSFCDRTVLSFDVPITAIVGPNGCGKSNTSDAVRWVLGEQSAKSLRGDKMFDVIFSGSSKRKAANFAEVVIVLSEINGELPLDYEEIAISRKLYRNGDSCYSINNQEVRLKDIHSLLMNTGLGKNSYSILEQGKMDEVIVASPQERRATFEQASGILRFKQSKKEALKKLEAMEGNIVRLSDISSEVDKQMRVLEKQAEKAKEFKSNKSAFEELEKSLVYNKWQAAQQGLKKSSEALDQCGEKIDEIQEQTKQLDEDLTNAIKKLEEEEGHYQEKNEHLFDKKKQVELLEQDINNKSKQNQDLKEKEKQLKEEVQSFFRDSKTAEKDYNQNNKKFEKLSADHEKLMQGFEDLREKVQKEESNLQELQQEVKQVGDKRFQIHQSLAAVEANFQETKLRLENNQEKLTQFEQRKKALFKRREGLSKLADEKRSRVQTLSAQVDEIKIKVGKVQTEKDGITQKQEEVGKQFKAASANLSECRAKQKVLQQMKESSDGLSNGAKALLKASQDPKGPFHNAVGMLSDKINTKKKYNKSIAALFRPYENTLYVEGAQNLKKVYQYIKKENLCDLSICLLDKASDALDQVPFIESSQVLQESLKNVSLVDEVDLSKVGSVQAQPFLTEDGALINEWGILSIASGKESNRFVRNAELQDLAKLITETEKDLKQLQESTEKLENEAKLKQQELIQLDKQNRTIEMKLVEENFSLQRALNDMNEVDNQVSKLESVFENIQRERKELFDKKKAIAEDVSSFKNQVKELDKEKDKLENRLVKEQGLFDKLRKDFELRQEKISQSKDQLTATKRLLDLFVAKKEEGEKHLTRLQQESAQVQEQLDANKEVSKDMQEKKRESAAELKEAQSLLKEQQKQVKLSKEAIEGIQKKIVKNQNLFKDHENSKTKVAIDQAQYESTCETMSKELLERYEINVEEVAPEDYQLKLPLKDADRKLVELRKKIETAGDVNMTSIEEFDKLGHRKEYLEKQMGDLGESKEELLNIIQQLDDESREQFKTAMDIINENFQKNFKILFNGGEASLKYTDHQDILEAGIDIAAKPPGKHMRSINLLSGGEKCMTAIALLFAIFEHRPAPFCVLDEIDAPLDDTNVARFVDILSQFINRTQFIVITHNKRTMAMADVLLGVSMQERGVSRILAMNFQKAEKLVEMAQT
ncbi:MAG: chromosome segregation protein SMC [Chlamydiales bacterium]|nr:chromosome segregation protein SMC [Chlamydiales bacterium]NCF70953.1 chromosome segregation protein SMC [Chlamydiales bacterium]